MKSWDMGRKPRKGIRNEHDSTVGGQEAISGFLKEKSYLSRNMGFA